MTATTPWSTPEYTGDRHQSRDLDGLFLQAGSNGVDAKGRHIRRDNDVPWSVCADVMHPGESGTRLVVVRAGTATSQEIARERAEEAAAEYLADRAA